MAQHTILVVDDEPGLAELYRAWLEESYDVTAVTSGQAAIAAVDGEVDAILLDRQMPDTSGDEVLAEIRRRGYDCPVALVTAAKPTPDVLERQFAEYVLKPVDREAVLATIERLLAIGRLGEHARRYARASSFVAILEDGGRIPTDDDQELLERARREAAHARRLMDERTEEVFDSGDVPDPIDSGRDPLRG